MTDDLTDAALVDTAAATLATPRERPADSFVLHAPLELLARAALLTMVEPDARDAARDAISDLERGFEANGPAMDERSGPAPAIHDIDAALKLLDAAITRGELDDADAAACWLADHLTADELASALADPVLPLLSAAGHGGIFLYHLPRIAPRSRAAARMLRGLVRELARYPGWELSWHRDLPAGRVPRAEAARTLGERLVRPPSPGDPGSNFIYPVMSLTETSGAATALLGDVVGSLGAVDARRTLLRTAAQSMLQDDADQAPYGWSHCLTMPQATLAIAPRCTTPSHAVGVAATYVLGFRSVLGRVALDERWEPPSGPVADPVSALEGSPLEAAAAAWHADEALRPALRSRLASHAAGHHDAHLVKYTLACFDAARDDPDAERLFLAAAAYLGGWWRTLDALIDPAA